MPLFAKVQSFFRNIFSPQRAEADLDHEVRSHLALIADENIRAGMPPQDAQRAAQIELGGIEQVKEQVRERSIGNWLRSVFFDCRYGTRQLARSPGFAMVAVLTLGLGIAINATMFSMVSAFLLRRPPGHDPGRIAVVTSINPNKGFLPDVDPISLPNFLDWRNANHVFTQTAAADEDRTANLTPQSRSGALGQPQVIQAAAITQNYFNVFGVSPLLGNTFTDDQFQPGRDRVVILSQELWERQFASDQSIIGSTIRLNRENYTVVGVMPANFHLLGFIPQLWTPLDLIVSNQAAARRDRSLRLFARLKPGVTVEQANAEFATFARRAEQDFPETEKGWGVAVRALPDFLIHNFAIGTGLAMMMTTVGFVLLIACANVAGLLTARATGRRKELAIRIALGAGRLRIIRQMLTENLIVAFLGGALGLTISYWGINFLRANMNFNEVVSAVPIILDWNVFLFGLGVSVACALLCGLAPALDASRTDVNVNLNSEGRGATVGRSHSRLRTVLVTCEIALTLFLLVGSGLLFRGIYLIEHQKLGFRADHLLTANIVLDDARYPTPTQRNLFLQNLLPRLQHLPGSESAAATSDLPAAGAAKVTFRIKDQPEPHTDQRRSAGHVVVTTDFFQTTAIPVLRGRAFSETDTASAPPVVVVNQEFVSRNFKNQEPLGKQIHLDLADAGPEWSQIVGVVSNTKTFSEDTREDPEVYEAFQQRPVASFSLMIRTASDPDNLSTSLRQTLAEMDPDLPLASIYSMSAVIDRQRSGDPVFVNMLAGFALLALLLSAIGIYGLIAYSVAQRTHEIGIRMALGAKAPDVLRMILRQALKMAAIGGAVGFALALPLPKIFEAMFYGLHFSEPALYFIVPVTLFVVVLLASYIPARRASHVDPMSALHQP
ncbi:MAG TPA: ABC transporter permease [Candidatus Acidoferrum sp.]|jgi:putative ABC transport system permease protein